MEFIWGVGSTCGSHSCNETHTERKGGAGRGSAHKVDFGLALHLRHTSLVMCDLIDIGCDESRRETETKDPDGLQLRICSIIPLKPTGTWKGVMGVGEPHAIQNQRPSSCRTRGVL